MSKFYKCQMSNASMSNVIILNSKKSHILIFDKKSDSWCIWGLGLNILEIIAFYREVYSLSFFFQFKRAVFARLEKIVYFFHTEQSDKNAG